MFNIYYTLKNHLIKIILNNVLAKFWHIVFANDGSTSSNHNIDMTSINTRMFDITFVVDLLLHLLKYQHS